MTDVGDVSAPDLQDSVPFDISWLWGSYKHIEREVKVTPTLSPCSLMNIMINQSRLVQINNKSCIVVLTQEIQV